MVVGARLLCRDTRRFACEYELCQLLGRGSFGEVWVCRERTTGERRAAKLIDKTTLRTFAEREDVQREIAILEAFAGRHEGVVRLHEVLEGESVVQLVMELCTGGDLFELLKDRGSLPEPAAKALFRQLVSAVAFCHAHGVVHRDIKPENILLSVPGQALYSTRMPNDPLPPVKVKLADFGLAAVLGPEGVTSGYTGSRYYTAPEMLLGRLYGRGADVWSVGVVLCTMLTGRLPFAGQTKQDVEGLRRAILRGRINFQQPSWVPVSEAAKDLVRRMLTVDPSERITADQLLAHPWLASSWEEKVAPVVASLPGYSSQSLPGSPVDTHRDMQSQRPYASARPQVEPEFRLDQHEGAVTARLAAAMAAPQTCATEPVEDSPGQRAGAQGGLSLEHGNKGSSFHPEAECCMGPLALSNLATATAGVWCLPHLLLNGWGDAQPQAAKQQWVRQQPAKVAPPLVTCSASSKKCQGQGPSPATSLRLGEPHKCLAPRQEFQVR